MIARAWADIGGNPKSSAYEANLRAIRELPKGDRKFAEHIPEQQGQFARDLLADPALAKRILETFPVLAEPEQVTIRADPASANAAIVRALALAVAGVGVRIELDRRRYGV